MKKIRFKRLHGAAAYLIWYIHNDFRVKMEISIALERNLELIADEEGNIFAYRYDHPQDMGHLVRDDGNWQFTDESKALYIPDFNRLKLLCRDYLMN
jgi:hypothetical protein